VGEWPDLALCCTGTRPPQKNPRTRRSRVPGTWGPLGNLPKLLETPSGTWGLAGRPQDVPDRFQGHFRPISGMFSADFRDFLGRFRGYSEHISLVLTIMEIDDWTIRSFFPSIIFVLH
jgi:hypothetical protein